MTERVVITSPANAASFALYLAPALVGVLYILGTETPEAMGEIFGDAGAVAALLGMAIFGTGAMFAIFVASRMADPSNALLAELSALAGLVLAAGLYFASINVLYEIGAIRATFAYALANLLGLVGRAVTVVIELVKIRRVRRAVDPIREG